MARRPGRVLRRGRYVLHRLRRMERRRLAALACLAVLGLLLTSCLPMSCNGDKPRPWVQKPHLDDGSQPVMRVRLSGAAESISLGASGGCRIVAGGRSVWSIAGALEPVSLRRDGAGWRIGEQAFAGGGAIEVIPAGQGILRLGGTLYRGTLRLLPGPDGRFAVVNDVQMEHYIAGVLARELYRTWHPETYRALAITARSFANYQHAMNAAEDFDVTDDQGSQVYGGYSAESDLSRQAAEDTWGQILICDSAAGQGLFLTQYSAACGGVVNPAISLRDAGDLPPLRGGQICNDCAACPKYRWPAVAIAKSDILKAVALAYPTAARATSLQEIRPISGTSFGRIVWVDVVGPGTSPIRLRADDLRLALLRGAVPGAARLYSMNCAWRDTGSAIEFYGGRGFGHGVGLCQWGAQGKAVQGWTARAILEFYYPGSRIHRLY